ncbi:MAG: inositol monophosphatase family protein [Acidimicrobiales bacterium]
MTDPSELRTIAADVASSVGREVAVRRANGFSWSTKSSATDVVTEIDTWSEDEVVSRISALRPDDGFLGEEGTNRESRSGVTWVIDPVDGTTNLLYDIPGYSVSIAASVDGTPVAGAVFDPIRGELFSAALGAGATRDGDPISASTKADLATALVGTGFSYMAEARRGQAEQLVTILPLIRDIRRAGGAAMDLCDVACGRLDAYYERGLSPWDSAAGGLIATEAGARVVDGTLTAASAPGLADEFFALLDSVGA